MLRVIFTETGRYFEIDTLSDAAIKERCKVSTIRKYQGIDAWLKYLTKNGTSKMNETIPRRFDVLNHTSAKIPKKEFDLAVANIRKQLQNFKV